MNSNILIRIAKNSIFGMLEKLVEISLGIASVVILARYLDVETFGLYALIVTYIGLSVSLGSVGIDRVMVRDIAANREKLLEYLSDIKGARIIIIGISLFFILIASYFLDLNSRELFVAVALFAISELVSMYSMVYMSVFKAFEKMEYNTLIISLSKTITFLGIIIVLYLGLGFLAIFASIALGNIFKALLTISLFKRYFSHKSISVSFTNSMVIVKESLIIAASTFFAFASIRMGIFMLKAFSTLKDVAFFQASNVLFVQLQPISVVIVTALYPVISSRERDINLIFEKAAKFIFMISLPLMALTFFYGNELITLFYGNKYMDAIPVMRILILSLPFTFLTNLFEISLLSEHRKNLLTTGWGIGFSMNLLLGAFIVPKYGLIGCATVMSLSYMTLFFALYFFTSIYTGIKIKHSIFIRPCVAFIVMVFYLYYFSFNGKTLNIVLDGLNISVSLVLYVTVLFLVKTFSTEEVDFIKNSLILSGKSFAGAFNERKQVLRKKK